MLLIRLISIAHPIGAYMLLLLFFFPPFSCEYFIVIITIGITKNIIIVDVVLALLLLLLLLVKYWQVLYVYIYFFVNKFVFRFRKDSFVRLDRASIPKKGDLVSVIFPYACGPFLCVCA